MPVPHLSAAISESTSLALAAARAVNSSLPNISHAVTNETYKGIPSICAWPVSGQYGPGSRLLYYVLIAACVLARRHDWIKNAALAAALIVPAVAALHGIVLATLHVDGAVDMDVYGAFQVCAIGLLAAPVTVRLSKTYFDDPGRNTIFLWATIILAGLMSLTVEFYRIEPQPCLVYDANGNPITNPAYFPYNENASPCNITCSSSDGPFSPLRGGADNQLYVIPLPDKLTFGAATLLAAGCCLHAILWLVAMFIKILENTWEHNPFSTSHGEGLDETMSGTNGATRKNMMMVNERIKLYLSMAVVPVFGGACLAILVVGELNFFSKQVDYQTEPMQSVGQWAPIVGTGLAVFGSLYLIFAADVQAVQEKPPPSPDSGQCTCNCGNHQQPMSQPMSPGVAPLARQTTIAQSQPRQSLQSPPLDRAHSTHSSPSLSDQSIQMQPVKTQDTFKSLDMGGRRKVAEAFVKFSGAIGHAAQERLDDRSFQLGSAMNWPEIPGEQERNRDLPEIRRVYNPVRDASGNVSPMPRSRSRAESFTSVRSGVSNLDGTDTGRNSSPNGSPHRRRPHASTFPTTMGPPTDPRDLERVTTLPGPSTPRGRPTLRRGDNLEVPVEVHGHRRTLSSSSVVFDEPESMSPPLQGRRHTGSFPTSRSPAGTYPMSRVVSSPVAGPSSRSVPIIHQAPAASRNSGRARTRTMTIDEGATPHVSDDEAEQQK